MISTAADYKKALEELYFLEAWLERLNRENPGAAKGMTKAGVRKSIARLHEELGAYEGAQEMAEVAVAEVKESAK